MPTEWWLSLSFAMLAIAVSPGNGAVLSMRYGLKGGVSYATSAIAGLQIGLLGIYGIVLLSLMLTTRISTHVLDVIALLGGSYLVFLGSKDILNVWKNVEASFKFKTELEANGRDTYTENWKKRLTLGALTNLTNPKGILFMTAFFPQWLQVNAPWSLTKQAIAMGCVAVVIDTTVMHGYAYLASIIRHLLVNPAFFRIVETLLGSVLCVMGVCMIVLRFAG